MAPPTLCMIPAHGSQPKPWSFIIIRPVAAVRPSVEHKQEGEIDSTALDVKKAAG